MNVKQMLYLKQALGCSYDRLSELSGVPKGTIQKIFSGETKTPRFDTLNALARAFEALDSSPASACLSDSASYGSPRESALARHTQEDYYALPHRRAELIDGVLYEQAAVSTTHQQIVSEYVFQLTGYIRENHCECLVFPAPTPVRLDDDTYTLLEPDILVICDRDKITPQYIAGAPDFIIEVLSPESRQKDTTVKLYKYIRAGVREYWIADPYKKRVTVYANMTEEVLPTVYDFEDEIPVGIYEGALSLSLKTI